MKLAGSCFCHRLTYELEVESPDDARTSLCHCKNCKVCTGSDSMGRIPAHNEQKAFGTNYGLTSKVAKDAFRYTSGTPKEFKDGESGVTREFCDNCGSYILEYGVYSPIHQLVENST